MPSHQEPAQLRRRKSDRGITLADAFTWFARLSGIVGGGLITALAWFVVTNWTDLKADLKDIKVGLDGVSQINARQETDIRVLSARQDAHDRDIVGIRQDINGIRLSIAPPHGRPN